MPATQFDRDAQANFYAKKHLKTDPGIVEAYYLPGGSEEREIRILLVNELMGQRLDSSLEPIDFGVDRGLESSHRLVFLDVTPAQWERMRRGELDLPEGWSLEGKVRFAR